MCAIVGISSCNKLSLSKRDWIFRASESMLHRGPDDKGEWFSSDGLSGFAHRRLSIIDLSSSGHQPMSDLSGEITLVFNGEIYNHKELRFKLKNKGYSFTSGSDSEVIIAAWKEWGVNCPSYFNGMFSFAIYDAKVKRLFLARDRAGEKPLFYKINNKDICFSSELKGLMSDKSLNLSVNHTALDCYLFMGYVPGDMCILNNVNKLPPGHTLLFDCNDGTSLVQSYWDLPDYSLQKIGTESLLNELDYLLHDSVSLQLSADVPVGVLLSGGIDSSLITAMAARTSNKFKTYTVSFPGYKKYDESPHAKLIAEYFSTDHMELSVDHIDVELLTLMAKQFDEPMCDSSMLPTYLVSQLVKRHCKVALGGDGGDELFGGYSHYSRLLLSSRYIHMMPMFIRNSISKLSQEILPIGFRGRNWLQSINTDFLNGLPLVATLFNSSIREKIVSQKIDRGGYLPSENIWMRNVPNSSDLLQRATRMDFHNYLAEDILVKIDRASMINSLEMRSPLLDYRIIEFAYKVVPSDLKATKNQRKILLKKLAKQLFPDAFDFERKQGFSIPLNEWLRGGEFRNFFHDVLLSNDCTFDHEVVKGLLNGQDRGRNNGERLFSLVMFELWRVEYGVSV